MIYTTLEKLKNSLQITDNSEDIFLTNLITECSALIDMELGDSLEEKAITRRINGDGKNFIILENRIMEMSRVFDTSTKKDIPVDCIEGYIVYLEKSTTAGRKNIEITYKKGFREVPEDFEVYFLAFCRENYLQQKATKNAMESNIKSKKIAEVSVSYFSPSELITENSVLSEEKMQNILKKYKNFTIVCS